MPHHDIQLLIQNEHLLREEEKEYLRVWEMRRAKSAYARRHPDYNARAALVLMSEFDDRHSFIWCGHRERKAWDSCGKAKRRMCKETRLCPRCNYVFRVKPLFRRIGTESTFCRACGWWFVTVGYTDNPAHALRFLADDVEDYFDSTQRTGVFDYTGKYTPAPLPLWAGSDPVGERLRILFWNAAHKAIAEFKEEWLIRGYLTADDLHVDFRGEGGMLSHIHSVVTAERFSQGMVDDLGERVQLAIDAANPPIKLYASIKVYRIHNHQQLQRLIRYVVKAIDFVSPYTNALLTDEARTDQRSYSPAYIENLNMLVDYFLESVTSGLFHHRRGFRLGGDLYYRKGSKSYIGEPPEDVRKAKFKKVSDDEPWLKADGSIDTGPAHTLADEEF